MTLNLCVGGSNSFAVATSTQKFGVMAIQVLVLGKKKGRDHGRNDQISTETPPEICINPLNYCRNFLATTSLSHGHRPVPVPPSQTSIAEPAGHSITGSQQVHSPPGPYKYACTQAPSRHPNTKFTAISSSGIYPPEEEE